MDLESVKEKEGIKCSSLEEVTLLCDTLIGLGIQDEYEDDWDPINLWESHDGEEEDGIVIFVRDGDALGANECISINDGDWVIHDFNLFFNKTHELWR